MLSKGHAAVCMYIAMAIRGFFSYEGIVDTYGQLDSAYGMHPCKVQLPGVEASTGSLGHGLAARRGDGAQRPPPRRTTTASSALLGDGETGEGSVLGGRDGRPQQPSWATSSPSSTATASS